MKAQSSLDNQVALIRYRPHENSLAKALELCQGLQRHLGRNSDPTVTANISSRIMKPQFHPKDFFERGT